MFTPKYENEATNRTSNLKNGTLFRHITKKFCLSDEKQNFLILTPLYKSNVNGTYLSIPGINTTPSFFFPSIFTTIGFSKRTWRRNFVSVTAGCAFKNS